MNHSAKTEPQGIDPQDCIVLFADLQSGIVDLTKTLTLDQLQKGVLALSRLATLFEMPVIVTGIRGQDGSDANMIPQIAEGAGEYTILHRTTCDSFRNSDIVSAIRASGRKTLLISGVATELAVQLPALSAAEQGFRVFVVVDACGGMSERTEQAALRRIALAGGSTVSVMTLAGEFAGDFREPRAQKAIGILYEMAG
jgi:nicotinamidase-related amidase